MKQNIIFTTISSSLYYSTLMPSLLLQGLLALKFLHLGKKRVCFSTYSIKCCVPLCIFGRVLLFIINVILKNFLPVFYDLITILFFLASSRSLFGNKLLCMFLLFPEYSDFITFQISPLFALHLIIKMFLCQCEA